MGTKLSWQTQTILGDILGKLQEIVETHFPNMPRQCYCYCLQCLWKYVELAQLSLQLVKAYVILPWDFWFLLQRDFTSTVYMPTILSAAGG